MVFWTEYKDEFKFISENSLQIFVYCYILTFLRSVTDNHSSQASLLKESATFSLVEKHLKTNPAMIKQAIRSNK